MPMLVCVKCKRQLRIEKNGVDSVEFIPIHSTKTKKFIGYEIYRVWSSDKWKCPECDFEILAGFPHSPWAVNGVMIKTISRDHEGKRVESEIEFSQVIARCVLRNVYECFTDWGHKDEKSLQEVIKDNKGHIQIILNERSEEDVSGTNTEGSGPGRGGEGPG